MCYSKRKGLLCYDEVIFLKELYLKLPEALKKNIAMQAVTAIIAILLFFIVIIFSKDIVLALPCLIFSVFMIVKSVTLFYNCIEGNYLEIKGLCSEVETTAISRRIKSLTVRAEQKTLKIPISFRLKRTSIGDTVTIYLSRNAQLYYNDGCYVANNIYALAVQKED